MDQEFQELENTLKGMKPALPDDACFERLLQAMEGRLQVSSPEFTGVERQLEALQPAALAEEVEGRLLQTVAGVEFPGEQKVVPFPASNRPGQAAPRRRPWFAAAAAVAVAGAFSALMVEGPATDGRSVDSGPVSVPSEGGYPVSPRTLDGLVPASVGSGVEQATDQGVRWNSQGQPVRAVKVTYKDRIRYIMPDGQILEFERPREETMMMPENID